jgi:coenzyme F420-reducing hydrogenase beta subunit
MQVCPMQCLHRVFDNEGFLYPAADKTRCVDCGKCERVCPVENPRINAARHKRPSAYAAYYNDEAVRMDSTSGGVWSALAEHLLEEGAYISGAVFDEDFLVTHTLTKDRARLAEMRSSKYSQSDTKSLFSDIKKLLEGKEKVFVCATPCQIAGLYRFLERDYANLYTCDLICKAVPSPKVFKAYLGYLEGKYKSKTASVKFKYKDKGRPWGYLTTRIDFKNGRAYIKNGGYDSFMKGFLYTGFTIRPSCFDCPFTVYPRTGDITLGDCWGVEHFLPNLSGREKGYSLVLVNSEKGASMISGIKENVFLAEIDLGKAEKWNMNLTAPFYKTNGKYIPEDRRRFYTNLDGKGYRYVNKTYIKCPANLAERIYNKITGKLW